MRLLMVTLALLSATAGAACAQPAPDIEPNQSLTPGEILETREAVVCQPGYSHRVRAQMPGGLRASVYRLYGIGPEDHRFVIDHRVPLSLGGANTAKNMWPEPKEGPMNSHVKDGLEDLLHHRVCYQHTMSLRAAQEVFLGDWVVAWHTYGEPPPLYIAE